MSARNLLHKVDLFGQLLSMFRIFMPVTALLSLSSCCGLKVAAHPVETNVYGPPINASETGQAFLYKIPKVVVAGDDGGLAAQRWSMLGREDKAAQTGSEEYLPSACPRTPTSISGWEDIVDAIATRASSYRIVIINESHTVTRHRELTRQLLPKLRSQGFTVLAAETFTNILDGPPPLESHALLKWAHKDDGFYSREPVFGRMIRTAKVLGFRLAAYEHVDRPGDDDAGYINDDIARREAGQAQNLKHILNKMGPDEKLLIHVGYAHATEQPVIDDSGNEILWMAARLKTLTGLDPLTVNQTECRAEDDAPFVAEMRPDSRLGWYDFVISEHVTQFNSKRPAWRRAIGDIEVEIPASLKPTDQPLVIEAFVNGEPFDSVPTDRVFVDPGENLPLLLPPGKYTIRAVKPFNQ
jgi:hypothetical protein